MGRPADPENAGRTATAIRLKPDLHERLTAEAKARDVSVNFLVNKSVAFFLEHLIPIEEMKWTR